MGPPALRRYSTCNLDVHVAIQQQILRLQVPVDDVAVVTILHRWQDLPELPPGLELTETAVLRQVVCSQRERNKDSGKRSYIRSICRSNFTWTYITWLHRPFKHSIRYHFVQLKIMHSCRLLIPLSVGGCVERIIYFWWGAGLVPIVVYSCSTLQHAL